MALKPGFDALSRDIRIVFAAVSEEAASALGPPRMAAE